MRLSIVTTLYHSATHIREFYDRMCRAADGITDDYEVIFVNDGSPDDSLDIAKSLVDEDRRVKVIDLSRNFGHHRAMMTGLEHADGDLVFLIDSDLEEEPELLNTFYEKLEKSDADVVYGVQKRRKGRALERVSGALFYWLFNLLSSQRIPKNPLTARLMTRRYVEALVAHRERELLIDGLWAATGFKQIPVEATKHATSRSTYTFGKKFALTIKAITGFSNLPLIYIAALGLAVLILAFLSFLYLMGVMVFVDDAPMGFPTIILSIWFLGGLIIFCVGVVAIYLSVIFVETKNRPYSIIRKVYKREG